MQLLDQYFFINSFISSSVSSICSSSTISCFDFLAAGNVAAPILLWRFIFKDFFLVDAYELQLPVLEPSSKLDTGLFADAASLPDKLVQLCSFNSSTVSKFLEHCLQRQQISYASSSCLFLQIFFHILNNSPHTFWYE